MCRIGTLIGSLSLQAILEKKKNSNDSLTIVIFNSKYIPEGTGRNMRLFKERYFKNTLFLLKTHKDKGVFRSFHTKLSEND